MKKVLVSAMVLLFGLTIATAAFAVQTKGVVVSLDKNEPSMVIKQANGVALKLNITPKTDIQRGMKDIPLDEFAPGTVVLTRYNVKDGKNVAKYIGYESGELQHFGTMKK